MSTNGNLSPKELSRIYHPSEKLYLEKDAAAGWNTMRMFSKRYLKVDLYPAGPISAYRTYEQQVEAKNTYGANAATPGTSNHGLGLAVDLDSKTMRYAIDRIGKRFGWAKEWSDASWEWWHLKYRSGIYGRPDPGISLKYPVARKRSGGVGQKWFVRKIQRRLRAHGFPLANSGGNFGKKMEDKVKAFQKEKKLKPDGVVGKQTWLKLNAKPKLTPAKPAKPTTPKPIPKPPQPKDYWKKFNTGSAGIKLIKSFEGYISEPYNDPAGYATIGYGHLIAYRPVNDLDRKRWGKLTEVQAVKLLRSDLKEYEKAVKDNVKVPLNQNQFDALVSWTYNLGAGSLATSTMLKKLNRGDYDSVPEEMARWNQAGGKVLAGLVRRRKAEGALFSKKA